ncbi:hypothetical protein BKA70DRAFT_66893 [Coprinopsis sp. MPI-PUGE-AT-0042]|nr:hypothetical protein BKA70DRAFT_66893 [Coprinopsis sp. MPI-PUGE-AT-0042]
MGASGRMYVLGTVLAIALSVMPAYTINALLVSIRRDHTSGGNSVQCLKLCEFPLYCNASSYKGFRWPAANTASRLIYRCLSGKKVPGPAQRGMLSKSMTTSICWQH